VDAQIYQTQNTHHALTDNLRSEQLHTCTQACFIWPDHAAECHTKGYQTLLRTKNKFQALLFPGFPEAVPYDTWKLFKKMSSFVLVRNWNLYRRTEVRKSLSHYTIVCQNEPYLRERDLVQNFRIMIIANRTCVLSLFLGQARGWKNKKQKLLKARHPLAPPWLAPPWLAPRRPVLRLVVPPLLQFCWQRSSCRRNWNQRN